MQLRRLQNVLKRCYDQNKRCHKGNIWFTTSWTLPIYDELKMPDLTEDVRFTRSCRRLIYVVLKTSDLRRFGDAWFTSSIRLFFDVLRAYVKRHVCSNVVVTSIKSRKKWYFLIAFRTFEVVLSKLVFSYEIL